MRFWSWVSSEFSIVAPGKPAEVINWIRSAGAPDAGESTLVRGAGRGILGTTDPQYVPGEGSLELLQKPFRVWAAQVCADNGNARLADLDFQLVIKKKSRTDTDALVDTIDFQFSSWDESAAQGSADPLVSTLGILVTDIMRGGVGL